MARVTEYQIVQGDNLHRIALNAYRDATLWSAIAAYNNLEAPFLVDQDQEPSFKRRLTASGVVVVTRSGTVPTTNAYVIPKGTLLGTTPDFYGLQKVYRSDTEVTLPANSQSVAVAVACTVEGVYGNTPAQTITQVVTPGLSFIGAVTNLSDFTDGRIWRIKFVGETILLPLTVAGLADNPGENNQELESALGGSDIYLNPDGEFEADDYGDLKTVSGINNIIQSVQHRLATERGSLVDHPEYGSDIHEYIGLNLPFVDKLIELTIVSTIQADTHVESASVTSLTKAGTAVSVEVQVKLIGKPTPESARFSF